MSAIICGKYFHTFTYIYTIFYSADDVMIILIIWEILNNAPLFLRILQLSNKKKGPPTRILALSFMSYDASL